MHALTALRVAAGGARLHVLRLHALVRTRARCRMHPAFRTTGPVDSSMLAGYTNYQSYLQSPPAGCVPNVRGAHVLSCMPAPACRTADTAA